MTPPNKTLAGYVEKFLSERDVTPTYAKMLRAHCRAFMRWSRRSVRIADVNAESVNRWLASLDPKLSAETRDTYRRNLLAVWRAAVVDGLNDHPPLRIRKIKKPRAIIHAYTHDEIKQLLAAASRLRGRHRNGNRRSDFWCALIHAAYSTALRRSDLLIVFKSQIGPDGTAQIVQSKTGHYHTVRFSNEALAFSARLQCPNGLLLPWPYRRDALAPRFQALKKLAGVNRGSLKWIRRSAASYAQRERYGDGPRILGHKSPQVFSQSYEDRTITGEKPPEPPRLPWLAVLLYCLGLG